MKISSERLHRSTSRSRLDPTRAMTEQCTSTQPRRSCLTKDCSFRHYTVSMSYQEWSLIPSCCPPETDILPGPQNMPASCFRYSFPKQHCSCCIEYMNIFCGSRKQNQEQALLSCLDIHVISPPVNLNSPSCSAAHLSQQKQHLPSLRVRVCSKKVVYFQCHILQRA